MANGPKILTDGDFLVAGAPAWSLIGTAVWTFPDYLNFVGAGNGNAVQSPVGNGPLKKNTLYFIRYTARKSSTGPPDSDFITLGSFFALRIFVFFTPLAFIFTARTAQYKPDAVSSGFQFISIFFQASFGSIKSIDYVHVHELVPVQQNGYAGNGGFFDFTWSF